MQTKQVLLVLTDKWVDWEAAYAIAEINLSPDYSITTVAIDLEPKVSIGGIRAGVGSLVTDWQDFSDVAMVILPGGYTWEDHDYPEIADLVRKAVAHAVPVAAICAATTWLAGHGFLNDIRHTGEEIDLMQEQPGYKGALFYIEAQVVTDDGFITANETAAVEFAYEIIRALALMPEEQSSDWLHDYRDGLFR